MSQHETPYDSEIADTGTDPGAAAEARTRAQEAQQEAHQEAQQNVTTQTGQGPAGQQGDGGEKLGFDGSTLEEIERDRAERLDPANRPENSVVDNSGRSFDAEKAMFTDEPGYEDAEKVFPPASEQGA